MYRPLIPKLAKFVSSEEEYLLDSNNLSCTQKRINTYSLSDDLQRITEMLYVLKEVVKNELVMKTLLSGEGTTRAHLAEDKVKVSLAAQKTGQQGETSKTEVFLAEVNKATGGLTFRGNTFSLNTSDIKLLDCLNKDVAKPVSKKGYCAEYGEMTRINILMKTSSTSESETLEKRLKS